MGIAVGVAKTVLTGAIIGFGLHAVWPLSFTKEDETGNPHESALLCRESTHCCLAVSYQSD